ncbi:MAG: hypothetical protein AAF318_13905 [Pseudomonadota bacterium]
MTAARLLLAALIVALALPAAALTRDQSAALDARLSAFEAAVRTSDYAVMVDVMPPRILEGLAAQTGTSVDRWKASFQSMLRQSFEEATLLEFSMTPERATTGATGDGIEYALIPTKTQIVMNAVGRIESSAHTLALFDGGRWYLMRLGDPAQMAELRRAYPGFAAVDLPQGTMTFLD